MKSPVCCSAVCVLLLVILFAVEVVAQPVAIYVAPEGNDGWSGRIVQRNPAGTDGPLATIGRAQQVVRQLRAAGKLTKPVSVFVGGLHRLAAPLVFTPQDSGTEDCPVTYSALPGQRPVLSGGRPITGWKKGSGEVWSVELPQVRAGKWYFRQLFVDQRRARRARGPNDGYFRVQGLVDAKPGVPWNQGVDQFHFRPGDLRTWGDLGNVEVVVFHSWNTSRVRVASIDQAKSVVRFTGPTIFRPLAWDPAQRYYVENARELLDSPGEWYLDRASGVLSYWPLPGQDMTKADVVAPVLEELVRFDGDPDKGQFVEHVRLVGLSFQHADWTLPDKGYGDPQAAVTVPAVVAAKGARHTTIERCEIAHVGTYGVWFSRGCKHNRIVQNHIHDLGAGGLRLGEPARPTSDDVESSHNLVTNNYLHDGGHVYAGAVGLWLAQTSHNEISHNEIHSFDYTGISVGWNWDFSPNRTSHNRIEQNHVHHVVRGMLSDAGGIYTLGIQTGTVIRGNVFHDIFPYMGSPAMAWGIYFDQGSSGLLVENNVVYHTLTGGLMSAASPGNVIRNNVFALSAWQGVWRWGWQREPASQVERNIFYVSQGDLFHADGGASDFRTKWDNNLYWRTDGRPLEFYEETFDQWQAHGVDRHSLVADPQFVDPARGDFRLRPGSPAGKLGIQSIDTSRVGLFGPEEWVNLPKQVKFPATVLPKPPAGVGPTPIDDDFEHTAVGPGAGAGHTARRRPRRLDPRQRRGGGLGQAQPQADRRAGVGPPVQSTFVLLAALSPGPGRAPLRRAAGERRRTGPRVARCGPALSGWPFAGDRRWRPASRQRQSAGRRAGGHLVPRRDRLRAGPACQRRLRSDADGSRSARPNVPCDRLRRGQVQPPRMAGIHQPGLDQDGLLLGQRQAVAPGCRGGRIVYWAP